MAGIVKAFSQRVGGKSALGLWEDTIWMDLGWYSLHAWDHRTDFEDPSLRRLTRKAAPKHRSTDDWGPDISHSQSPNHSFLGVRRFWAPWRSP
ncbi:hypothetical protein PG989_003824 [Apiospora arundinis]